MINALLRNFISCICDVGRLMEQHYYFNYFNSFYTTLSFVHVMLVIILYIVIYSVIEHVPLTSVFSLWWDVNELFRLRCLFTQPILYMYYIRKHKIPNIV